MQDDFKIKFELSRLMDFSDESLINELLRVSKMTNNTLTSAEFKKFAKVSCDSIRRRFGSWKEALTIAGLGNRYSGQIVSEKMKSQIAKGMTDSEFISELQRVSKLLNKEELSQQDFNENSEFSASTITRRFGNWSNGLKLAGLNAVKMAIRYSEFDYFENLLNVWTHYGRQPKYGEMNFSPSTISSGGYEKNGENGLMH